MLQRAIARGFAVRTTRLCGAAVCAGACLGGANAAVGESPVFALPRLLEAPGPVYEMLDVGQLRTESRGPSESVVLVHASVDLLSVVRAGSGPDTQSNVSAQFPAGDAPRFIDAADMDGDGDKDFVLTYTDANRARIVYNRAESSGALELGPVYVVGSRPAGVAIGDFNRDGIPDFATANNADHELRITLGAGGGIWNMQPQGVATAWNPWAVRTADFNGDGALDLLVTGTTNDAVALHLGDGQGGFGPARLTAVGDRPTELVLADFDGDGDTDAACIEQGWGSVRIIENRGGGLLVAGASMYAGATPGALRAGDLNGDGLADLAAAVPSTPGEIALYVNDGDGGFAPARLTVNVRPGRLELADLNKDGIDDLLVSDQSSSVLVQYDNETEPPVSPTQCPGDLDGDRMVGTADLLVLLSAWGAPASGPGGGDATGDGLVGTADLLVLLSVYGSVCPQ